MPITDTMTTSQTRARAAATRGVPDSLVLRWDAAFRFAERGWSANRTFTDACVDAAAATALWDHLDLLSVDNKPGTPRPSLIAIKDAFASATARFAVLTGGATIIKDDTTAFLQVEVSPRVVRFLAAVSAAPLAALGPKALDDLFTISHTLHDALDGHAYLTNTTAWTDWDGNAPAERLVAAYPMRLVAEILNPGRPQLRDEDANLVAVRALATTAPPPGVTRTTYGGLVELRWVDDPRDAAAANDAGVRHEAWTKGLVKHEPMAG